MRQLAFAWRWVAQGQLAFLGTTPLRASACFRSELLKVSLLSLAPARVSLLSPGSMAVSPIQRTHTTQCVFHGPPCAPDVFWPQVCLGIYGAVAIFACRP